MDALVCTGMPCLAAEPDWLVGEKDTTLKPAWAICTSQHLHHPLWKVQAPLPASFKAYFARAQVDTHLNYWKHAHKDSWKICLHTCDIVPEPFYFPKGSLCTMPKEVFLLLHRFQNWTAKKSWAGAFYWGWEYRLSHTFSCTCPHLYGHADPSSQ